MLCKESGYKLIILRKEGEKAKREEEREAKRLDTRKIKYLMSQVFMLHVENIEILDTYDREMKIAKKPVETLTPRSLQKIKIKIKKNPTHQ